MATAYSATSSTSMAAAAATTGFLPLVSAHTLSRGLALPYLPTRRFHGVASKNFSALEAGTESQRFPLLKVKATSTEESSIDAGELFNDLKEKWDAVENKSTVILYGGGAVVAVWFSSTVVGAINSVPLLPKLMELVGLGYTGWFVYRYLLFKSSRKELAEDIDSLKKKIAGTE